MRKIGTTISTNEEAKNRLELGIFGIIPAALVGGIGGAITSLVMGIIGANKSLRKADKKIECFNNEKNILNANYENNKKHMELKNNNEKYACMSNEDCEKYLKIYRQKYPMSQFGDYKFNTGVMMNPVGIYKTTLSVIDGKENKLPTCGILYQDLVRLIDTNLNDNMSWTLLYYMDFGKKYELYLYDLDGSHTYFIPQKMVRTK